MPVGTQYEDPAKYPDTVKPSVEPIIPTTDPKIPTVTPNLLSNDVLANLNVLLANAVNQVNFIQDMITKVKN